MLTLINKNYRSTPCSQNIVQILSLFLKNSSIFPSNNFWIFRPKYSNIRIIFGFWKCPRIEYEYQYSEENIRIFEYSFQHWFKKPISSESPFSKFVPHFQILSHLYSYLPAHSKTRYWSAVKTGLILFSALLSMYHWTPHCQLHTTHLTCW